MAKHRNIDNKGVHREPQTLTNVRKNLDLDDISALCRIANTFIALCEDKPELVQEYHFGQYTRNRCANVDKFREEHPDVIAATGAGSTDMVTYYKENATYILEEVLLGRLRRNA